MAFFDEYYKFGDSPAIIDGNLIITWKDIDEYASFVREQKIERSLVFCFCENSAGCMMGYLAMLRNRIVPLMLDCELDISMVNNLIQMYHPEYLYVPDHVQLQTDYSFEPVFHKYGYQMFREFKNANYSSYALFPELAVLLTTSGSTGSPKLVRQSYKNIQANASSIAEYLGLSKDERPITSLPMHYTYGLSVIQSHTFVGACIVCTRSPIVQNDFWSVVKNNCVTSFAGVPYTYEMLKKIHFFQKDYPYLKTLTQAGGKLSPELHKEIAEYAFKNDKHFVVMYGQTEATARMAYLPWEKSLEKAGSMGIAIPGGSFELIDENGSPIHDVDQVGELVYSGPNVTLGYAECGDDLAAGDERNGILETGDMAKQDEDGFYYIVGRKKRFLKIFGSRVNLDETERLLHQSFQDIDCVCSGKDDLLCIYLTDDSIKEQMEEFVEKKMHINHRAICTVLTDVIPRNNAGKTLYNMLPKP